MPSAPSAPKPRPFLVDLPEDTDALLAALDKFEPERSPDPTHNDRQVWILAGRRQIVRDLVTARRVQLEKRKKQ